MPPLSHGRVVLAGLLVAAACASVRAQDVPSAFAATAFHELRFEDDWSDLEATDHAWPELKLVELDESGEWVASVGGEVRARYESGQDQDLTGGPGKHDNSFSLFRLRLHGDLRHRDGVRVFVEAISAGIRGNEASPASTDEDTLDLLNAFVELPEDFGLLRFGRMELSYGAGRLIGPNEWQNVPRSFQGALARFADGDVTTDVFLMQPVNVDEHDFDDVEHSQLFGGVYATWFLQPQQVLDLYGLMLLDSDDTYVQTQKSDSPVGDLGVYTLGARYADRTGAFDCEFENAWQFGSRAGSSISALMWTAIGGYTVDDWRWQPRFALDLDFASGDSRPGDDEYGTFNQLFPDSHDYFGYLDLVGRQNVMSFRPNVTLQVAPTASLVVAYSDLELSNTHDYLYDAEGNPTSPKSSLNGNGGKDIGQEIDLALSWRPERLNPHGRFLFGYSELDPAKFVDGFGDGARTKLYYVQATFGF